MLIVLYIFLFLMSALLCHVYIKLAYKRKWLDIPNQRSSHQLDTPRGGGLIFIALWLITLLLLSIYNSSSLILVILLGTTIVAITGLVDDHHSIPAKYRALLYTFAAIIILFFLGGFDKITLSEHVHLPLSWLGSIFALLAIVWSTNLFNFMDGIDGIAATQAIFMLIAGGVFLYLSDATSLALLATTLAACVGGFLVWNKPPAKLFMGDVGSTSLGFIIIVFALIGEHSYGLPFLLWIILYMTFLFDATMTLFRRILAGEKWYKAHRLHAYQRLHQAGWSHQEVLLGFICINSILSIFAIIAFFYQVLLIPMLFSSLIFTCICYYLIERIKPMYSLR